MRREELDDCGGEFWCDERASVIAWNANELGILQKRRQFISVGAFVPITDRNKCRDSNLCQSLR